jgi:hypothetical protein
VACCKVNFTSMLIISHFFLWYMLSKYFSTCLLFTYMISCLTEHIMFNVPFTIAFEAWNHHQPLRCGTLKVAHIKGYWIYKKHEYYRLKTHNLVNFKGNFTSMLIISHFFLWYMLSKYFSTCLLFTYMIYIFVNLISSWI